MKKKCDFQQAIEANDLFLFHFWFSQITDKVLSDERFEAVFLEPLLNLAKDPVPNIRLNVANLLSKALLYHGWFS